MKIDVIIGAGSGDCGKGITARRCVGNVMGATLGILTNGGAQRGHTVQVGDWRHVYKHFSSTGTDTYFGPEFLLDPIAFRREREELPNAPDAFIDDQSRFVTPFDILANQNESKLKMENDTCGMGIWHTLHRLSHMGAMPFMRFMQLSREEQYNYIDSIRQWWWNQNQGQFLPEYAPFFEDDNIYEGLIDHFLADCLYMHETCLVNPIRVYDHWVLENGQGLRISNGAHTGTWTDAGFYSDIPVISKLHFEEITEINVHYVTRTYETRHGADSEFKPVERRLLSSYIEEDKTNVWNEFQGQLYHCPLDVTALQYRIIGDLSLVPEFWRPKVHTILDVTHCDEIGPEQIKSRLWSFIDEIRCWGSENVD